LLSVTCVCCTQDAMSLAACARLFFFISNTTSGAM
jgi:hypothetical protein